MLKRAVERFGLIAFAVAFVVVPETITDPDVAAAPAFCDRHKKIVSVLGKRYKETRFGIGLSHQGAVFEVYASETGTFSALLTLPDGRTCVMLSGHSFEAVYLPGEPT